MDEQKKDDFIKFMTERYCWENVFDLYTKSNSEEEKNALLHEVGSEISELINK